MIDLISWPNHLALCNYHPRKCVHFFKITFWMMCFSPSTSANGWITWKILEVCNDLRSKSNQCEGSSYRQFPSFLHLSWFKMVQGWRNRSVPIFSPCLMQKIPRWSTVSNPPSFHARSWPRRAKPRRKVLQRRDLRVHIGAYVSYMNVTMWSNIIEYMLD